MTIDKNSVDYTYSVVLTEKRKNLLGNSVYIWFSSGLDIAIQASETSFSYSYEGCTSFKFYVRFCSVLEIIILQLLNPILLIQLIQYFCSRW